MIAVDSAAPSRGLRPTSLVVLNPAARGGRAGELWSEVQPHVARYSRPQVVCTDGSERWIREVHQAIAEGTRLFLAAGGDGTVHGLVNALCSAEIPPRTSRDGPLTLGAIGLGSSNDYHKPFRRVVGSVPLRVDPSQSCERDVGVAQYLDPRGRARTRHFLVSASVGMAAEANAVFNEGDRLLQWFKPRSTSAAIAYAALKTFASYRNRPAMLSLPERKMPTRRVQITNLSVMKTPYLSGWLRFDTLVEAADGRFAVNLCEGLSRPRAVQVLLALSRGRLQEQPSRGIHQWRAGELSLGAAEPFALELDGEVHQARRVCFSVLAQKLRCCS